MDSLEPVMAQTWDQPMASEKANKSESVLDLM